MTPEERQLLEGLFERIKTAAPAAPDKDADEFIGKSMKEMPHAGYVLSQAVIVQEEALKGAVSKIEELEAQVQELQEQAQKAEANSGFLGGIGKSLFGGSEPPERPSGERSSFGSRSSGVPSTRNAGGPDGPASGISVPPPPGSRGAPAWNQQGAGAMGAGPMGQQPAAAGGGNTFLKGALGAAAGVAGGMLLANAVGGLFSGSNNPLGIGSAKASENKSASDDSSGDDWGDDKSSNDSGDNWDDDAGNDWDDDDAGSDWGDDGGDSGGSWDD